jgi:dihydrofolate reductase
MIAGVFAVDDNGGMGYMGRLPWPSNKDDMQWFKKLTQDQIVVMGKKTWESPDMPSPLPGRLNVLFTNNFIERDDIEQIRGDVCDALVSVHDANLTNKNIYVIGGPQLLTQCIPVLEKLFITRIPGEFLSDTFIDLDFILEDFSLIETLNLGSCKVEVYNNETIS